MSREYTKLLIEALDNGTISHEDVSGSFLTFFSEDQVQEFVESDFNFLIKEEKDSLSFSSQEEEDDYNASNPPPRNHCLECGDDFEWFMHNCDASPYNEEYGCSKCDDYCGFCRS